MIVSSLFDQFSYCDPQATTKNIKTYLQSGGKLDNIITYLSTLNFTTFSTEEAVYRLYNYCIIFNGIAGSAEQELVKKIQDLFASQMALKKPAYLLLYNLVEQSLFSMVTKFFEMGFTIDSQDEQNGYTVLHYACTRGFTAPIQWLLEHKANPNIKTYNEEETPFHIACRTGNLIFMRLLFQHNAKLDERARHGDTALHFAAARRNKLAIKFLVKNSLEIDAVNEEGCTPLHIAGSQQNYIALHYLIDQGADFEKIDSFDETPLDTCYKVNLKHFQELKDFEEEMAPHNVNPKDLKGKILDLLNQFKRYLVSSMIEPSYTHYVHYQNRILQWIDIHAEVSENISKGKIYFRDTQAEKITSETDLDEEECRAIFFQSYTPANILRMFDENVNESESIIDKDLIMDFYKELLLPDCHEKLNKEDRKYLYLAHKVMDKKGVRIKKSKLLNLLAIFGIIEKIQ